MKPINPSEGSYIAPTNALPPPRLAKPKSTMNITYQQLLDRANILYKNKIQEKYLEKFPDLDMNKVELKFDDSTEALLEALIEILNENK